MKILVCITHVPDTTSKISFLDDTTIDMKGIQFIIGPYDDYALARAIELKQSIEGCTVTVLNVGENDSEPSLRRALAIGADNAIRINTFPSDSILVSHEIAKIAKENNYDLIMMGKESIDYHGGIVHAMVSELLKVPFVSPVMKLDVEGEKVSLVKEIDGGKEFLESNMPLIVGCQEPIAEWKIPNMRGIMTARKKIINVVEPSSLEASSKLKKIDLPPKKENVKIIDSNNIEELVRLLKKEAKVV